MNNLLSAAPDIKAQTIDHASCVLACAHIGPNLEMSWEGLGSRSRVLASKESLVDDDFVGFGKLTVWVGSQMTL